MGKHFALTLQLPAYNRARTSRAGLSGFLSNIQTEQLGLTILALTVVALLAYLIQVNTFATKGYEIKHMQNQLGIMQDQHEKLEVQAAQLQSIQNLQNDPGVLNMVPVSQMTYVQAPTLTQR